MSAVYRRSIHLLRKASNTICIVHVHYIPKRGVGNERLTFIGPWALSEENTLVTRTTLKIYGPVSTNYRQGTSSILESDEKLGTDPLAVGGVDGIRVLRT